MSAMLARLLAALASRIPPQSVDRVWIFPPRQLRGSESGLALLALYDQLPEATGHRRLVTLRYEAAPGGEEPTEQELVEQGIAPAERIDRVVAGVLRRLGDAHEAPTAVRIEGDPARWEQMLGGMAEPSSTA
ncbi:MAG: hypothetical protein ACR2H9_13910 [Longimicrobiaceae bacterium]